MSSRALATTGTSSIYKIDWNEVDRYVRSKTLLNCAKITYKSTTETLLRCDQSNGDPSFFSSPSCIVTVELNVLLVFYVRVPNRVWRLEGLPQLPISVRRTPRGGPKGGHGARAPKAQSIFYNIILHHRVSLLFYQFMDITVMFLSKDSLCEARLPLWTISLALEPADCVLYFKTKWLET